MATTRGRGGAKRLIFSAFAMNTGSHIWHGTWRHPDARQAEFNDLAMWVELAQLLERGRFDALFLADVSGLYGDYKGGWETFVREGLQIPSNDPLILAAALILATEHLGIAITSSIVQEQPFNFARRMSTLDHLSKGAPAGTSSPASSTTPPATSASNGLEEHDERYARAEEYCDVAYKLWEGSWEDDALEIDRAAACFTDPAKIHKIDHRGARYSVEGPHLPSPSPQRSPLLFQAGSSPAGREFAARHAEASFIAAPNPKARRRDDPRRACPCRAQRARCRRHHLSPGRDAGRRQHRGRSTAQGAGDRRLRQHRRTAGAYQRRGRHRLRRSLARHAAVAGAGAGPAGHRQGGDGRRPPPAARRRSAISRG